MPTEMTSARLQVIEREACNKRAAPYMEGVNESRPDDGESDRVCDAVETDIELREGGVTFEGAR